jgi:threonine dehydrogenase-like Zn-dependent dehydrogenase
MRALVFDGQLKLEDRPKPRFTGEECLVRVLKAGICNTDLEITRGYFGFNGVLGHEFVGVVEASLESTLIGKRVVGEINAACQQCEYCAQNLQRHCPNRTVLGILKRDGAFREYLTLPQQNLHLVPDNVSDQEAVFTEPIAAACEIVDQVEIGPSHSVVILGDGKLGLLISMVLSKTGCSLTLVGKHANKMNLLSDYPIRQIPLDSAQSLPKVFDVVVEATGSACGWELALRLVKPRGTLVLKSTFHGHLAFNPAPIVVDEITVIGSRCGRFEPALRLLEQKEIHPTRLLYKTLPLDRGLEAFEMAQMPGVLKVLLEP